MDTGAVHRYLDPSATPTSAPRRALFLDRDGVINVDTGYVHTAAQTHWLPGIFDLVAEAVRAGYAPVVVTNQAGIARGYYSDAEFLDYTRWVHAQFAARGAPLLATVYSPHHPEAGLGALRVACECRKPAPGMLLAAAQALGIDLGASLMIGDTPKDIAAARAAGVGRTRLLEGALGSWQQIEAGQ
jgi:D-glycero-D-manno-heptose 1,7-bisphosphate phosphatase